MMKFQHLLLIGIIIGLFTASGMPVARGAEGLIPGTKWANELYSGGQRTAMAKHSAEINHSWSGELIWEIRGEGETYFPKKIDSRFQEMIYLNRDMTLRYYEISFFTGGRENRLVCEWSRGSYWYAITEVSGFDDAEFVLARDRTPVKIIRPLYVKGMPWSLEVLLKSGLLAENSSCLVLEPSLLATRSNPEMVIRIEDRRPDVIRLPGDGQTIQCYSFILAGAGELVYTDIAWNVLAIRDMTRDWIRYAKATP